MACRDLYGQKRIREDRTTSAASSSSYCTVSTEAHQQHSGATAVTLSSSRFNEASRLVVSEILRRRGCWGDVDGVQRAIACYEKWVAIAESCYKLHNYCGLSAICAAFSNCAIFKLLHIKNRVAPKVPFPQFLY